MTRDVTYGHCKSYITEISKVCGLLKCRPSNLIAASAGVWATVQYFKKAAGISTHAAMP